MSPKIGMKLDARPYAATSLRPLDRVRMAINVVESQGMRVTLDDDHGVGRHKITGGWIADGPYRPRRVSLLGAICLALQPMSGDTVEGGAACALEVSADWLWGLWDGFQNGVQVSILQGPAGELYLDALRGGHMVFAEVTTECPECGERRHRREHECHACR